jgi:iron complex outermembrane receptor protein
MRATRAAAIAFAAFVTSREEGLAQSATQTNLVETVTVIGTTPLPGTGIDVDKLPLETETLNAADLDREGAASATTALNDELGSVNINDNLDDPFQPDIQFRGFEASPVLGTPAGLAVYQNGVRINEGFGDTLNWDLLPDPAIGRIDLLSASPVYGLNALGGAVIVSMKNGFDFDGVQADASGGSWGQRQGSVQYGTNDGALGFYAAGRWLDEDGWRERSPDSLRQLYADLSYRAERLSLDFSYTADDNRLSGESATPVQELAVDRSLIFTSPQANANRLQFLTLNASYAVGNSLTLQGNAYYRDFHQSVVNGNTTDDTACTAPAYAGFLCQADAATPLFDRSGSLIPDLSQGGTIPLGENDFEDIATAAEGGTLQVADTDAIFGHSNQLTLGGSLDRDSIAFGSRAELGTINPQLVVGQSGIFVSTPEGTDFTATPVGLNATSTYYGLFATDTFDVTPALSITASGRYNLARLDLADQLGSALSGNSEFHRFNPAIGFSWRFGPTLTAYGGYSEGNRAPTPAEIECSSPTAPCLLPSSLSADPPNLHQVVSRTFEAGLRGRFEVPEFPDGRFTWNASLFRTEVDNDIYAVATSLSEGFFQNIAGTRRQGADFGLHYRGDRLTLSFDYSTVAATFQSNFLLPSPLNSSADTNGDIRVRTGDALPGIPAHRIKLGADYTVLPNWTLGGDLIYDSPQYFRGDESNQMKPLAGFAMLNMHTSYAASDAVKLYLDLVNVTDAKYATFGVLGDPTGVGAPGVPTNGNADDRFESPGAPLSAFAGIRIRL